MSTSIRKPLFSVRRTVGCYNLCNPKEESACYSFCIPGGHPAQRIHDSHCVAVDSEYDVGDACPFVALESMLNHAKSCIYSSDTKWLEGVSKYVDENHERLELDSAEVEIIRLEYQIDDLQKTLTRKKDALEKITSSLGEAR